MSGAATTIPNADEFVRQAFIARISVMLDELEHPLLVERAFPRGWRTADRAGLINLYELCRRTFLQREKDNG